jgi:transposase
MSHISGKPLTFEEKKIIIQLKNYFDRNKAQFQVQDLSTQMVADAMEISLTTVNRVMAAYRKDPNNLNISPQPKGRPEYSISDSNQEIVRSYIRSANLEGRHITLEMLRDFIRQNSKDEFHIMSLSRTLDRWGFEFGKGTRTQNLKEKDYIIAHRHRYLRKMRNNREKNGEVIRPEVYLDESYVNKNHSNDFIWYASEDGPSVQKPTGNGERFVIVSAITKDGWVPNAKIVFKSTKKTGDYHGQMNWMIFEKWFSEKLLPNIPEKSLIVMDNASYHSVLSDCSAPTPTCSKERILQWLASNNNPCNPDCLKAELIEVLAKTAPTPTYAIDEIAAKKGHEVVRTPPYHPELQPIEICWGVLKNEIARHCDFTMKNLETQLENAFNKVTGETCRKIIKKIREVEDKFWIEDALIERNAEVFQK